MMKHNGYTHYNDQESLVHLTGRKSAVEIRVICASSHIDAKCEQQ